MSKIETPDNLEDLPEAILSNLVILSTSGFGVVVALAWNELIKKFIEEYVDPYLGRDGSLLSLLIYALVVTLMAIVVTMQLGNLRKKFEKEK